MVSHYILLPGPPHEMEPMFTNEATPYLFGILGKQEVITSRVLKFYGIGEAELEFRIQDILGKANKSISSTHLRLPERLRYVSLPKRVR